MKQKQKVVKPRRKNRSAELDTIGWKGKSLSNTVDGQFVKSLRMRMGEGKEHKLLVEHGVCH